MKISKGFARHLVVLLALIGIGFRSAIADEPNPPQKSQSSGAADQLETVHLILHAAEPSYAALKIRLLPTGIDQTPGNAAPQYFRAAMAWNNDQVYVDALPKIPNWSELPLKELGQNEEAQKFFNSTSTDKWELIRFAAHKEYCQWDLPLREYTFATHIPELQKMRDLARLLAFKARIEISRGQIDQAVETIQSGFAIARHAAQGQTLVNGLVGIAIAGIMFNQVQELMQQPHSPNLYWSLSALPNPFIDLRPGLEFEQDCLYFFIPQLRDVRQASHTEAVWDTMLLQVADKMIKVMSETSGNNKDLVWFGKGALFAVTAYPKAKQQLQDAGYTRSQIDAMPASQAILTATVETFEHERDEMYKWLYSPSPEAVAGLAEARKHLSADSEVIPVASLLLPSLVKVKDAEVRSRRELAALRCVEALRWYAFQHHNQLPQQLSEIKEISLPNDPMTGQPFSYELNGGRALITSPAPPGEPANQGLRWEIQLAGGKK